jgi:hypothetical protein
MKKKAIPLIAIIASCALIGAGVSAFIFLTLQPDTWTITVSAELEAKLIHPDWTADYNINFDDLVQDTAWFDGLPEAYVIFGDNNVENDVYLRLQAVGAYIDNGGTVDAEIVQYHVSVSGGVTITPTHLIDINDINSMTVYDIPLEPLQNTYPTSAAYYLGINFTFNNNDMTYGDYTCNIQIHLTETDG